MRRAGRNLDEQQAIERNPRGEPIWSVVRRRMAMMAAGPEGTTELLLHEQLTEPLVDILRRTTPAANSNFQGRCPILSPSLYSPKLQTYTLGGRTGTIDPNSIAV